MKLSEKQEIHFHFFRGLIREKEHWQDFAENLLASIPNSKAHFIEIPGTGQFFKKDSFMSLKETVEFCRAKFTIPSEPGTIHIAVAISLGGMVISEWIKYFPKDFMGIVLMNTSFKDFSPFYQRVQPKALWSFLKIGLTSDAYNKEKKIVDLVINTKSKRAEVLKDWFRIGQLRPVSNKNAFYQIIAGATFKPVKAPPKELKILFLAGMKDRLCHYKCSVDIHQQWEGEIKFHPTAGHNITTDAGPWVIQHILEFVQSNFSLQMDKTF